MGSLTRSALASNPGELRDLRNAGLSASGASWLIVRARVSLRKQWSQELFDKFSLPSFFIPENSVLQRSEEAEAAMPCLSGADPWRLCLRPQMMQHYRETPLGEEGLRGVRVTHGFTLLRSELFSVPKANQAGTSEAVRPLSDMRRHVFEGFLS